VRRKVASIIRAMSKKEIDVGSDPRTCIRITHNRKQIPAKNAE
jgi:hypothetical protein